jgi:hypothetical protein
MVPTPNAPPNARTAPRPGNNFTTVSTAFEVEVKVQLNGINRSYFAILRRVDIRKLDTLNVWWK